jgi:hypothetical protein
MVSLKLHREVGFQRTKHVQTTRKWSWICKWVTHGFRKNSVYDLESVGWLMLLAILHPTLLSFRTSDSMPFSWQGNRRIKDSRGLRIKSYNSCGHRFKSTSAILNKYSLICSADITTRLMTHCITISLEQPMTQFKRIKLYLTTTLTKKRSQW